MTAIRPAAVRSRRSIEEIVSFRLVYWYDDGREKEGLTLCLSTCNGRRLGSNNSWDGSKLIGDWRRPRLHKLHSGLMRPQNAGPAVSAVP